MAADDKTAGPRRQTVLIAIAAIGIAIILFVLWLLLIRTPYAPAFTGLTSADALTITQELDRQKTPYELAEDGTTILVPEDRVDAARVNVLGGELPLKGAVGFELFNKTDMGLTEFAQKINYQRALQGELARTIMALDEIENARVHLSLPEEGIFEKDRRPAKASITVATKLGGPVDQQVVAGIQQLVASAVPELSPANVAILDARGELLSAPVSEIAAIALTPEQQQRQAVELDYASRIEEAVRRAGMAMPLSVKVTALRDFGSSDIGTEDGADESALEEQARSFPLNVTILFAAEPGSTIQNRLLTTAREAINFDTALGDIVQLQTDPALAGVSPPLNYGTSREEASATPSTTPILSDIPWWPFALLILAVLAIFLFFRFRTVRPVALTTEEREAFSQKLKNLLDREMQDGRTA